MSNKTVIIIILSAITAMVVYFLLQYAPTPKQLPIDKRDLIAQKPAVKGTPLQTDAENLALLEKEFTRIAVPFENASPLSIKRIWVEGSNFFVEYENSKGALNQLLLQQKGPTYQVKALFVGSEGGGWSLVKGEGSYVSPRALLYEKNSKEEWTKRN